MAIMIIDKHELKNLILRMMDALSMTRIVWIIMMIMMMRSKMLMIIRSRLKSFRMMDALAMTRIVLTAAAMVASTKHPTPRLPISHLQVRIINTSYQIYTKHIVYYTIYTIYNIR